MENFMSNENNEEIELFDYMDEESESRKIPVNKKEKTGGKMGSYNGCMAVPDCVGYGICCACCCDAILESIYFM